ncbi:MAG TPA: hypothetical protein VGQ32_04765, partial [Thermoanaerobaculia bacterium]|nr:hypothetical protein [Thermoanaerobaculia bacterium]
SPFLFLAILWVSAGRLLGQQISDLEPERPVALEDARPVSYKAFSGSADWTYNARKDSRDDYGPGFSLLYGALRRLEVGGSVRYVTSPSSNANRGVSSGDIQIHALYGLATESASLPALAVRVGVEFPTGLDSKGTDLHAGLLATRSFDIFRLHVNGLWTRLGDTGDRERKDRWEAIAGMDWTVGKFGRTDTLLVADADLRSNPLLGGKAILAIEGGVRQRIGSQTLVFFGAGSSLFGETDRVKVRLRAGISHIY